MAYALYASDVYKETQRQKAKDAWKKRLVNFKYKTVNRICLRPGCGVRFTVAFHDPKAFCTQSCAAQLRNKQRGRRSYETRMKISKSLKGHPSIWKGTIKVPHIEIICGNPKCQKTFSEERWRKHKFCSIHCAMSVIGGQPASPKASKGKNGIRKDISPTINFYSRWEANMARLYNYLNIKWEYAPKSFDIGGQMYTPDFYLSETDSYVEVKNFWWTYSKMRDEKFRKKYPHIRLEVILKDKYLQLESQYSKHIPNWEYRNSI